MSCPFTVLAQNNRAERPDQITGFTVGSATQGDFLYLSNRNDIHEFRKGNHFFLGISPGCDPYAHTFWTFRFTQPIPDDWPSLVLEIQFLDQGAGVIAPEILSDDRFDGEWMKPKRQVSYTRLNTNKVRSAIFEFAKPGVMAADSRHPHLRITGLQNLHGLFLYPSFSSREWDQVIASIPVTVTPMVSLESPMEIVTTAGVPVHGTPDSLHSAVENVRELAPLARVLGFTSIEVYIPWDLIEPKEGQFDFTYFDTIATEVGKYGLKLFPLLIVGSAYALPEWFKYSQENIGFVCLEHGLSNPIQSIWSPSHRRHVTRVLQALGEHYEPMGVLEGVRLGPSGNYGESQYPAGGNWGYKSEKMHIHIGYWAGDAFAVLDFQKFLVRKYGGLPALNNTWQTQYEDISTVKPLLPCQYQTLRARLDMTEWYTQSMTDWCEWWAIEARRAMPNTKIYQSSGGWGFREAGTDFSAQARSMKKVHGGIRMTNETDSLQQNIYVNRLAATAARLYEIPLGYEPASSHTARGVVGRIFTTVTTNGEHFFTYHSNLFNQPCAIDLWLENYSIFNYRQRPLVEVAVYYPETMNQLDDGAFRHLYAWGFYPRVAEIRRHIEVDHLDENLIREGYLDRYKVLIFAWGNVIENDVLQIMDQWLRKGGTIIYPSFPKGPLVTVEEDSKVFESWQNGDTGHGIFSRFPGDMEPPSLYGDYVENVLKGIPHLHPWTRLALEMEHPEKVFSSIQEDGHLLVINYSEDEAHIRLDEVCDEVLAPYSIVRLPIKTTAAN